METSFLFSKCILSTISLTSAEMTMIRKIYISAIYLVLCTFSVYAQNRAQSPGRIYGVDETISVPHWYIQMQAGTVQTDGKTGFNKLNTPAAAFSAGYKATSLWGIRIGISGWQAKGAWHSNFRTYKFNYLQGNADITLDLSNLFCYYNPERLVGVYMFMGLGINRAFNNDDAIAMSDAGYSMPYLWRGNKTFVACRTGLGTNFRLSNLLSLNIEINSNMLPDKFNSKKANHADWQFNALAGLTFNIWKSAGKYSDIYDPAPLPVYVSRTYPEKQEESSTPIVDKKAKPHILTEHIFFRINSATIRMPEENKILNLVYFLKKKRTAKVYICGYSDVVIDEIIDLRLSKSRALAVRKALKAKGIAADRITVCLREGNKLLFCEVEDSCVVIYTADE